MNSAPLYTAEQVARLMAGIFSPGRDKRSPEYMAGCHAALTRWLTAGPATHNPHPAGSAAADAWWAGWDEGREASNTHLVYLRGAQRYLSPRSVAHSPRDDLPSTSRGEGPNA